MSGCERVGKLVTLTMTCPAERLATEGAGEDTTTNIALLGGGVGRGERDHRAWRGRVCMRWVQEEQ
jgi:hypothetical protein